jgi:UDP-glucose 4-epimerase
MPQSYFRNKSILITGGLGFIGSSLARKLVSLGAQVKLIDSLVPQYGGNLYNIHDIDDRVHINISDVRDRYSMEYLIKDVDVLFNLAGQTSHLDSMEDPFTDLEINSKAQLSILETCRRYDPNIKIVFASTRQIYGKPEYLPVDEKHPLRPVDINGINKLAGENYHVLYNDVYDIHTCVLRLTNTYGPGMRIKDARQTFVGIWIRLMLEGKPFEVWGGDQLRDFTYVDDCVEALLMAAASPKGNGRLFNLGGSERITLRDLAQLMVEIHGKGEFVQREFPSERKKIDIGDYYSDYSLISSTLGWAPKVSLRKGIKRTIEYYRAHLEHYL